MDLVFFILFYNIYSYSLKYIKYIILWRCLQILEMVEDNVLYAMHIERMPRKDFK